jgi:TATA-box binding protein (TBP) (component of TFIID and TFIIIB)
MDVIKDDNVKYEPTGYKISTITATGSVNTNISLDALFEYITITEQESDIGIVYAEYGSHKSTILQKGQKRKWTNPNKPNKTKKRFDNQVTIVCSIKSTEITYRSKKKYGSNDGVMVNSKIFKNGNIQMTGLRYIDQGTKVIDFIIEQLKSIHKKQNDIVDDIENLENRDYRIRLINCDFKTGIEIKRDKLYKLILSDYKVSCTYEPCIYPGVKIQYWWNSENIHKDGSCHCDEHCNGKGNGEGNGECKKITIAVFQSGCIIITGGQSIIQINESYDFICKCLKDNLDNIIKPKVEFPMDDIKKKKVLIKKSTIK